jgi:exosortase
LSAITPNSTLRYGTGSPATAGADERLGPHELSPDERGPGGLSKAAWVKIGVITFLLCAIFWPNLSRLWLKTNPIWANQPDSANWQHAFFVPLIGLFYLYVNREQILAAPVRSRRIREGRRDGNLKTIGLMFLAVWVVPAALLLLLGLHHSALGLQFLVVITLAFANTVLSLYVPSQQLGFLILIEGLAVAMFGIWPGRNDFVWDVGMVITVFGVVLMLAGWDVMKVAWFPIAFLICALPWPGLVYSWIAGPLQVLAAKAAVVTLRFTGVEALRVGTKMMMMEPDGVRILNVAEACAGLRSLMTFITLGAAIAFLSSRPLWQKGVVVLSAIPIAIFCNMMRVTGQGLLDHYGSRELAVGFAHQFVGIVMLIPAFLLLLGVAWLLDHLFLEEVDDKDTLIVRAVKARNVSAPAAAPAAAAAPAPAAAPAAARPATGAAPAARPPGAVPREPKVIPVPRTGAAAAAAARSAAARPPQPPPQQRRDPQ